MTAIKDIFAKFRGAYQAALWFPRNQFNQVAYNAADNHAQIMDRFVDVPPTDPHFTELQGVARHKVVGQAIEYVAPLAVIQFLSSALLGKDLTVPVFSLSAYILLNAYMSYKDAPNIAGQVMNNWRNHRDSNAQNLTSNPIGFVLRTGDSCCPPEPPCC